jgi:hypothetical protein
LRQTSLPLHFRFVEAERERPQALLTAH